MTGWLLAALFFLAVFNPAAVALLLARADGRPSTRDALLGRLPAVAASIVVLALLALGADGLLDALELSLSTFQIAAGVLIVFGALQAFLALGLAPEDVSVGWANVRLLVWLLSPTPLALAVAVGADEGFLFAATALLIGALAAFALAAVWLLWRGLEGRVLLSWLRCLIAAGAVLAAVNLIRQGVENV